MIIAVTYTAVFSRTRANVMIGVTKPTTAAQNFLLVSFLTQSIFFMLSSFLFQVVNPGGTHFRFSFAF